MNSALFFKGLLIGFSIAAPVGPIGVLCIRRTLARGRLSGLASGLGAATADAIYGCTAGFGLTFISSFLIGHQIWLRLLGGAFLCYLGVKTLLALPAEKPAEANGRGLLGDYSSTCFLTLTNPLTILSFTAIFAGLGVVSRSYGGAFALVGGVFTGSALWWAALSAGVGLLRSRFDAQKMRWVNRISGIVILGFGLAAMGYVVRGWF